MRSSARCLVAAIAAGAIFFANCYAPQFAHAAHAQFDSASSADHHHASMPCHSDGAPPSTGPQDEAGYCCAAACAATAFIFGTPMLDETQPTVVPAVRLAHGMRAVGPTASDPPPRF